MSLFVWRKLRAADGLRSFEMTDISCFTAK
jgi:hypothetical protein